MKDECRRCDYYNYDYLICDYLSRVGHSRTIVDGVQQHWEVCPVRSVGGTKRAYEPHTSRKDIREKIAERNRMLTSHLREIEEMCCDGKTDSEIIKALGLPVSRGILRNWRSENKVIRTNLAMGLRGAQELVWEHAREGYSVENISFLTHLDPVIVTRWAGYIGIDISQNKGVKNIDIVPYRDMTKFFARHHGIVENYRQREQYTESLAKLTGITKTEANRVFRNGGIPSADIYRMARDCWNENK